MQVKHIFAEDGDRLEKNISTYVEQIPNEQMKQFIKLCLKVEFVYSFCCFYIKNSRINRNCNKS